MSKRPLWQCPDCGKAFAQAGQSHSCGQVPLDHHFTDQPRARELFDALLAAVEQEGGPVRLSIAKTRIGLITRITFAAVTPRQQYLRAHLLLRRRVASNKFIRIDEAGLGGYVVHVFEIRDESDIDDELRSYLRESYRVGQQERP